MTTDNKGAISDEEIAKAVRAAGGIVHSDGNIFLTNANKLREVLNALAIRPAEVSADAVKELFQPWPADETGPTDEPESQYRFGYNTAIEDALDALGVTSPVCDVPPSGWHCTRKKGHDGPCAAIQAIPPVPAEPEHTAIYLSKRLTGSDKDAEFIQAHINQAISEAIEAHEKERASPAPIHAGDAQCPDCFGAGVYLKAAIAPPPPDVTCNRCGGCGKIWTDAAAPSAIPASLKPIHASDAKVLSDHIPHTKAGFEGCFYCIHRRMPTPQEYFDAGMRSGRDLWGKTAPSAIPAGDQRDRLLAALERASAAESALRALADECDNDMVVGWEDRMTACIANANSILAGRQADAVHAATPQRPTLTMDGHQLLEALDFIAPDRDTDLDQLDGEVSFHRGPGHDGKGLYCWLTEDPDEGSTRLREYGEEAKATPDAAGESK